MRILLRKFFVGEDEGLRSAHGNSTRQNFIDREDTITAVFGICTVNTIALGDREFLLQPAQRLAS
jgi:hypothetical protein